MKSATSTGGAMSITAAAHRAGSVVVPGDKSVSHRALLLSAMAQGQSTISGLSSGDDVLRTKHMIGALGAQVSERGTNLVIDGPLGGLTATHDPLDCGNSGTAMRLLAGVCAGLTGTSVLVGDASLSSRPMDRVAAPLEAMGARVGVGARDDGG